MEHQEKKLHITKIPNHLALILDGNGRWALKRGLKRYEGHQKGIETLGEIARAARPGYAVSQRAAAHAPRFQPPNRPKKLVCVMPSTRNRTMRANSTPMMMSIWWTLSGNLS